MSGVVVFIGYILLIPSFIGMFSSGIIIISSAFTGIKVVEIIESEARTKLTEADIPKNLSDQILNMETLLASELNTLSTEQRQIIDEVTIELSAASIATGLSGIFVGGFAIFIFIPSLISGLLGWLLVMKKKVLQCTSCGALTPIS